MKFIEREHINVEKWDALVAQSNGLVFSTSNYLDAVAENWCIYVDKEYSKGIAIPYVKRLGKKSAYTPLFLRCLEWLGSQPPSNLLVKLKASFPKGDLSLKTAVSDESIEFVFQEIVAGSTPQYNEQARRMIRKFDHSTYSVVQAESPDHVLKVIAEELPSKIGSVNKSSLVQLESLVKSLKHLFMIRIIEVRSEGDCVGGAIFIEDRNRIIYLKSAFRPQAKKEGAMYRIMDLEIQKALKENKSFDFGGSRVDGVRRFNLNMGGGDCIYSNVKWDSMPIWYKGIKALNDKLHKK
jgi:hypothetical protein